MNLSRRTLIGTSGAAALMGLDACKKRLPPLSMAVPSPVWWNAVPIIAERHGFLKNRGFDLRTVNVETGVKAREAVVGRTAAMGLASTNAFTTASDADLGPLRILASVTQTSSMIAVLSRITEPSEMVRGRIGYTPGTISQLYLIAWLQKGLMIDLYMRRQLLLVPLDPPGLVSAFQRGDIDVAVTWEPYASQIAQQSVILMSSASPASDQAPADTGDDAGDQSLPSPPPSDQPVNSTASYSTPVQIRDPSLYTQQIFAVAHVEAMAAQKASIDAALQGLKDTCAWINSHRAQCAAELETSFKYPAGYLSANPLWSGVAFDFDTNPESIHAALLRDHQLGIFAGVSRASLSGLNALTTARPG